MKKNNEKVRGRNSSLIHLFLCLVEGINFMTDLASKVNGLGEQPMSMSYVFSGVTLVDIFKTLSFLSLLEQAVGIVTEQIVRKNERG